MMRNSPLAPPIKCQGIKTKLTREIAALAGTPPEQRWIEPFCGSAVVAFNIQPPRALLCDTNIHIIRLYRDVQAKTLDSVVVKDFLREHGEHPRIQGEDYYYAVRERFNTSPNSLDFLFLNRSCFNGVMRFNRSGYFNVPFCRKPERFSPAYITKIGNQLDAIAKILGSVDWEFKVADFKETLAQARPGDFVYADPPYTGRHVDYFNAWPDQNEAQLAEMLSRLPCKFILSTWHSNQYQKNGLIKQNWASESFHIHTREHYYHVWSTENLRHPMLEALITNFSSQTLPANSSIPST